MLDFWGVHLIVMVNKKNKSKGPQNQPGSQVPAEDWRSKRPLQKNTSLGPSFLQGPVTLIGDKTIQTKNGLQSFFIGKNAGTLGMVP